MVRFLISMMEIGNEELAECVSNGLQIGIKDDEEGLKNHLEMSKYCLSNDYTIILHRYLSKDLNKLKQVKSKLCN